MIDESSTSSIISMRQIKMQAQSLELLQLLSERGLSFFSADQIAQIASEVGLQARYLKQALAYLEKEEWIAAIHKNFWVVLQSRSTKQPTHPFVIAMALTTPAAISHWSALVHHGLVLSSSPIVYLLTQTNPSLRRYRRREEQLPPHVYPVGHHKFHIVQIKPELFFGMTPVVMGLQTIHVTDLERTLWDAVTSPQHCGEWTRVEEAFFAARHRLDVDKLVAYALRGDTATAKRVGWLLEYQGQPLERLQPLLELPIRGLRLLHAAGPKEGPCNMRWMLRINTLSSK
jgi:predicted transcriptional regulator of viral defense system